MDWDELVERWCADEVTDDEFVALALLMGRDGEAKQMITDFAAFQEVLFAGV